MDPNHPVLIRSGSSLTPQSILLLNLDAAASASSIRTSRTASESSVPSRSATPPVISFAPLPTTEPRKRRKSNARPLGVAGRSEMIRRSHRYRDQYEYDYQSQHDLTYVDQTPEEDDALIELGRLMKKAGKNLWGKIGGVHNKHRPQEPEGDQELDAPESSTESIRDSVDDLEVKVPILVDDIRVTAWDGSRTHELDRDGADEPSSSDLETTFDPTRTIRG